MNQQAETEANQPKTTTPTLQKKYYFTQLHLIIEILYKNLCAYMNRYGMKLSQYRINQQGDICRIFMKYCYRKYIDNTLSQNNKNQQINIQSNNNNNNTPNKNLHKIKVYIFDVQLTAFQIQTSIKFHIIYRKRQLILHYNDNNELYHKQKNNKQASNQSHPIQKQDNQLFLKPQITALLTQKLKQHDLYIQLTPQQQQQKSSKTPINNTPNQNIQQQNNNNCNNFIIADDRSFEYVDQFWINYKNYLPKKRYQSYQLAQLYAQKNKEKSQKLVYIFRQRIIRQIVEHILSIQQLTILTNKPQTNNNKQPPTNIPNPNPIQSNPTRNSKTLFITALANNYNIIYKYLTPKQYKNICVCERQVYKILNAQKNYKVIFEQKWGKTGFGLQERNWAKVYQNKILEEWRKKGRNSKVVYTEMRGFYI